LPDADAPPVEISVSTSPPIVPIVDGDGLDIPAFLQR
jgi:hypothetical protein